MPRKKKFEVKDGDTLVEFVQTFRGYNAGEKATFRNHVAKTLIDGGVAQEPGVLAKIREAAVAASKPEPKRAPAVGKKGRFLVDGLGDATGEIIEVPKDGPIRVRVGEGDDADEYEVERSELVVLE